MSQLLLGALPPLNYIRARPGRGSALIETPTEAKARKEVEKKDYTPPKGRAPQDEAGFVAWMIRKIG